MNLKSNIVLLLLFLSSFSNAQTEIKYTTVDQSWKEGFGNHRAVIEVSKTSEAVRLDFDWRRHDANPNKRSFLIVNAKTGDTIQNM